MNPSLIGFFCLAIKTKNFDFCINGRSPTDTGNCNGMAAEIKLLRSNVTQDDGCHFSFAVSHFKKLGNLSQLR